jgi:hypothetical protein
MASIDDVVTTMKNAVVSLGNLTQTITKVFPQTGGTATTATGGSATLPSSPVGFVVVTLPSGSVVKLPYYAE